MAASGKASEIVDALLTRAGLMETTGPQLPVAFPAVPFTPPSDGRYLQVDFMGNRPAWEGVRSGVIDQGLLQVIVVWPRHGGLVQPYAAAEQVKTHFAKNSIFRSGSTAVKISAEPYASAPLYETAETKIPVTIPWSA